MMSRNSGITRIAVEHSLFLHSLQVETDIDNGKSRRPTCQWHNLDTQTNLVSLSPWHVFFSSESLSETLSDMKQCLVWLSGPVQTRGTVIKNLLVVVLAIKDKKAFKYTLSYYSVWFSPSDKNITNNEVPYTWGVFWTKLLFIARFLLCSIFVYFYPWNKACFNGGDEKVAPNPE